MLFTFESLNEAGDQGSYDAWILTKETVRVQLEVDEMAEPVQIDKLKSAQKSFRFVFYLKIIIFLYRYFIINFAFGSPKKSEENNHLK